MIPVRGYAANNATTPLEPFSFNRRDPGEHDVLIDIEYCGVCHSDIHMARNEWGGTIFPVVPGHEIVGRVAQVGNKVTRFRAGDLAGVGCFVDSCRTCESCRAGLEQYCQIGMTQTYSSREKQGGVTYGGYSTRIVVDESYTLKVPKNLDLARVAPLLCAGITTYSPMRAAGVERGQQVGVVGLGGLGHMAVKIASAFGAEVTVFSTSPSKEADAKRLGAAHFVVTKSDEALKSLASRFDFLIDTVSAPHDINRLLNLLKRDGRMTLVGVPPESTEIHAFSLIMNRRQLTGSLIGGIRETQEMLDFCGDKNVMSDIELIPIQKINEAYERTLRSDVRYRFVIDLKSV